jgi:hypothetical protein
MTVIPPMRRVPVDADDATRDRMYREYVAELVTLNPRAFLPPGVKKRWWHLFKVEYPQILLTVNGAIITTAGPLGKKPA